MSNNKDLKFEGQKNQVKGKIRQMAGIVTDNEGEQLKGKAQNSIGKAEEKAGDVLNHVKKKLNDV